MDFWDLTYRFFSLSDANVRWVLAGSILLGGAAGALGTFVFLQKKSLLGDTLSHAALPGVGLAFLLVQRKEFIILLLGAALTGWLGAILINTIVKQTRLKLDAALGIILTTFFGLGIVILTAIQKSGIGAQAGLDKFLFGQAAAMTKQDILVLGILAIIMLLAILIWFGRFKLITFDPDFSGAIGMRVGWLQFLLTTLVVLAVTVGLQAVGVVLMAAMLVTPAAAARQWTERLPLMILLAALFGMFAGMAGAYASFLAPHFPTGPWMVVAISAVFFVSIMFAPRRGIVSRLRQHYTNRRRMTHEHILKVLFRAGQELKNWQTYYPISQIMQMWSFTDRPLRRGIAQLKGKGMIEQEGPMYRLSDTGVHEGARVTRLHRLWEVYLSRYLELPQDHVHRDAEDMEHILTPEMEARLEALLDKPALDPHKKEIPYLRPEGTS
jgi:manganese/zinc/iron transport system permease protein